MTTWQPDLDEVDHAGALTLVVGWRRGRHIESAQVETEQVVEDFLRDVIVAHLDSLDEQDPKPYSVEGSIESGEEHMVVRSDQLAPDGGLLASLDDAAGLDVLDARSLPERSLLFYAIVVGDDPARRASFIRKTNPVTVPRPGKLLTRLGTSLRRVKAPVFAFDDRVDVLVVDGGLLVTSESAFRQLFADAPELVAQVPSWLRKVTDHLPMSAETVTLLEERAQTSRRLRRRLQAIHERGHLAAVTLQDVADEAVRQGIDPDLIVQDGEMVIDELGAEDVFKLLNEDLMTGGLSGQRFAVDRKSPR